MACLLPLLVFPLFFPAPALADDPTVADPIVADLVRAYPEQFVAIEGNDLVWHDGAHADLRRRCGQELRRPPRESPQAPGGDDEISRPLRLESSSATAFIWGGKWYQDDTMHFEQRPELLPGMATR